MTLGEQFKELSGLGLVDFLKTVQFLNGCLEGLLDDFELLVVLFECGDLELECFFADWLLVLYHFELL